MAADSTKKVGTSKHRYWRDPGSASLPSTSAALEGRRFDVLAAVSYARKTGAKTVSVVGASMGGDCLRVGGAFEDHQVFGAGGFFELAAIGTSIAIDAIPFLLTIRIIQAYEF